MERRRLLAAVSAAQLAVGLSGLVVAVRRRHPYDFFLGHGAPDRVGRDALWMGTALSAPAPMLVAQAVATGVISRRASRPAAAVLGLLGTGMVGGYPIERLVRRRLRPSGWEPLESLLAVAGIALAAAMAALGRFAAAEGR